MTKMRLQWPIPDDVDTDAGPLPTILMTQITTASSLVRDMGCEVESEIAIARDEQTMGLVALLVLEAPDDFTEADMRGLMGVLRGSE